jgi:hypothetical protein
MHGRVRCRLLTLSPSTTTTCCLVPGGEGGKWAAYGVHPARQRAEDAGRREARELLHRGAEVGHVDGNDGGRRAVFLLVASRLRHTGHGTCQIHLGSLIVCRDLEGAARGARLEVDCVVVVVRGTCCRRVVVLLAGVHRREHLTEQGRSWLRWRE